jgi:hypothetical protein|tara:strand:+ start:1020 stop:1382 length:363 start_codon:yes stop_codon:yes gene_type:complete
MIIVEIQEVSGTGVVLNETKTTIETSLDLVAPAMTADNVTVEAHNTVPGGTLTNALQVLADQFFRGPNTPSGSNLGEGDLWYDTDDDQLKVYRETSSNNFEFVPLAQATGTMDTLDGGNF